VEEGDEDEEGGNAVDERAAMEAVGSSVAKMAVEGVEGAQTPGEKMEYGGNQRDIGADYDGFEEDETPKKKGLEGLIETSNPNAIKQSFGIKLKDMKNQEQVQPMSRKEREEAEKAAATERYRKKHELGLTEEYRKDMATLEKVKARRAAQAEKKQVEEEAEQARTERDKAAKDKASKANKGGGKDEDGLPKLDKIAIKKMKPALMKEALKARGLAIQGSAADLTKRLTEFEAER